MLRNASVTSFNVSELSGENQQGMGGKITPPTLPNLTQIWVKDLMTNNFWNPTPSLIVGLGRTMTNFIHSYKFYYHKFIYLES